MWHRLGVGTSSGEIRGYQWRDIDLELFTEIATGSRPRGDDDAQLRDSTTVDRMNQNRIMFYCGVENPETGEWVEDLEDPATAFTEWAQEGPGT